LRMDPEWGEFAKSSGNWMREARGEEKRQQESQEQKHEPFLGKVLGKCPVSEKGNRLR